MSTSYTFWEALMRCLGQISDRKSAEKFVAFLYMQGITTQVEPVPNSMDDWEIWVREEDRLGEAVSYLQQFSANPEDPRYAASVKEANVALQEKIKHKSTQVQNVRKVRYRSNVLGDRRIPPLTLTLVILCSLVSVFNNFGSPDPSNEIGQSISRQMMFVSPFDYERQQKDPLASVKRGQVWRAVTPIFLHQSPFHLVMNVIGLVILGRVCERWLGTTRFALLVFIAALFPNLLQAMAPAALRGTPFFGGISGVVYALFGLVWIRSTLNPMHGIYIPFVYLVMMLLPIGLGFSGIIPNWNQADLCHLGGLLVGVIVAYIQERG
ncbi:MAG: rhomboid family intramembrane serine protease [Pirellulales bacterium]